MVRRGDLPGNEGKVDGPPNCEVNRGHATSQGYILRPTSPADTRGSESHPRGALTSCFTARRSVWCRICACLEQIAGAPASTADHTPKTIEKEALGPRGGERCAGAQLWLPVKAPGFGDRLKAMLEDIAVLHQWSADPRERLRSQVEKPPTLDDARHCPPHPINTNTPPSWPMQRVASKPGRADPSKIDENRLPPYDERSSRVQRWRALRVVWPWLKVGACQPKPRF